MASEARTAEGIFVKPARLNHRTHGAVEHRHTLVENLPNLFFTLGHFLLFPLNLGLATPGSVARATKISTGRLPFRANRSPAKEPVKS